MRLSQIKDQITNQITEIKEELKNPVTQKDPNTKKFVKSISQSYKVLLELDEKNITPKLNEDLQKLSEEIEKLNKVAHPNLVMLRSVLAVFEALQEDLKMVKDDAESLKRGERVEKVDTDRMEQ